MGIKRGKHIFEQGTKWNVGSDSGLSFWLDKWLIEGELRSLILGPLQRDEDKLKISDMVHEGRWNVNLCSFILPPELILRIRAIPTPKTTNLKDTISWGLSPQEISKQNPPIGLQRGVGTQLLVSQVNGFGGLAPSQKSNVLCGNVFCIVCRLEIL